MITQSQPSSDMTYYDPLASQFMTGGQMSYMPSAQFLTDPSYGAFRTMPGPAMAPTAMHTPTTLQSWLTANRGTPPGMGPSYLFNTYNPAVDQVNYLTQAQRRSSDQLSAIGGGIGDFGWSSAVGLGLGMLSPGLGLGAGLVAPSISRHYLDRIRQGRQIQNMSMSKIVGGSNMAQGLGQGFSGTASVRIGENLRDLASESLIFNNDDMKNIMQLGIEHGQFDYSLSVGQYKDTMKKLTKNMKAFMELLGTSDMKTIFQEMQRLQTMGASVGDMRNIMQNESMYSRMTGLSHADMVSTYGQQGALMYSEAGLTNYQGSLANMSNAATVTMMQRMGLLNPGELARAGGISGLTQNMTSSKAQLIQSNADFILPFIANKDFTGVDQEKIAAMQRGEYTTQQIMQGGAQRLKSPGSMVKYQAWRSQGLEQWQQAAGDAGMDSTMFRRALEMGRNAGIEDPKEAAMFGFMIQRVDHETARQIVDSMTESGVLDGRTGQLQNQRHRAIMNDREEEAFNRGLKNIFKLGFKKWSQGISSSTYGEFTRWRMEAKDRKENQNLGISSVERGVTGAITTESVNEETLNRATLSAELGGWGSGFSDSDRYDALTRVEKLAFGKDRIGVYKFMEEFVQTKRLDDGVRKSGDKVMSESGLNLDILEDKMYYKLRMVDVLKEKDVWDALVSALKDSGVPTSAAIERAEKIMGDPNARKALMNRIYQNRRLKKRVGIFEKNLGSYKNRMYQTQYDKISELRNSLGEDIGEMTKQGFAFGLNDVQTRDKLIESMGTSVEGTTGEAFFEAAGRLYDAEGVSSGDRKKIDRAAIDFAASLGIEASGYRDAKKKFREKFGGSLSSEQLDMIYEYVDGINVKSGGLGKFGKGLNKIGTKAANITAAELLFGKKHGQSPDNLSHSSTEDGSGIGGKNEKAIELMDAQVTVLKDLKASIDVLNTRLKTNEPKKDGEGWDSMAIWNMF